MQEEDLKIRARMAFLQFEWPMRVDEKVIRYYTVEEQEAVQHVLAPTGPMAQAMNESRELDAELEKKKESLQEEPEEVEFNLDDWMEKDHYYYYTVQDQEEIEAFEHFLATGGPSAKAMDESREVVTILDDEESPQEGAAESEFDFTEWMVNARDRMMAEEDWEMKWPYFMMEELDSIEEEECMEDEDYIP